MEQNDEKIGGADRETVKREAMAMLAKLEELFPTGEVASRAMLGACLIHAAIATLDDYDLFYWIRMIIDPAKPPQIEYTFGHEQSLKVVEAAVEAGVIDNEKMTIVVIADKQGRLDISNVSPTKHAADHACDVLSYAALVTRALATSLAKRFEVAKS